MKKEWKKGGGYGSLVMAIFIFLIPFIVNANIAPVIDAVSVYPDVITPGTEVTITVNAHDPDCASTCTSGTCEVIRSDLTSWSATGGSFLYIDRGTTGSPYVTSATWVAPATGSYTVTVTIGDGGNPFTCGQREYTSKDIIINVTTGNPPVILSITPDAYEVSPESKVFITAQAVDPEGGDLTWEWSASGGKIMEDGDNDPSTILWVAPISAGVYYVTVKVTDPELASAQESLELKVKLGWFLSSLPINGDIMSVGRGVLGESYVVDGLKGKVYLVSPDGMRWKNFAEVKGAKDVDFVNGKVFVSSSRCGCVKVFSQEGKEEGQIEGFSKPQGIAYAPVNGILYVTDAGAGMVYGISPNLQIAFFFTGGSLPADVAVSDDGRVAVSDMAEGVVRIYDLNGNFQQTVGAFGSGLGEFIRPYGVAFDWRGWLYVVDSYNDRISVFDNNYVFRGYIGSYGDLRIPKDVEVDITGRLLIASSMNSAIVTYLVNGVLSSDRDADGMPDVWEVANSLNPEDPSDAFLDPDSDGLINVLEYRYGSSPFVSDSDSDGVSDGEEVKLGLNPVAPEDNLPVAYIKPIPSVVGPSVVVVDGSESSDPNGEPLTYHWEVDGPLDKIVGENEEVAKVFVRKPGDYTVRLFVSDGKKDVVAERSFSVVDLPPYAEAGNHIFAKAGEKVVLNGTPSFDPNGENISCTWIQLEGKAVSIKNADKCVAEFVPEKAGYYKFILEVRDDSGLVSKDEVDVFVNGEVIPEAFLEGEITGEVGEPVFIRGNILPSSSFHWEQVAGSPVELMDADTLSPYFVPLIPGVYKFRLIPEGGIPDEIVVKVKTDGISPVAVIKGRHIAEEGTVVPLSGRDSVYEGDAVYIWAQESGPPLYLDSATSSVIFVAPINPGRYVFSLTVCDANGCSLPAYHELVVKEPERRVKATIETVEEALVEEEVKVKVDVPDGVVVMWEVNGERREVSAGENILRIVPQYPGVLSVKAIPFDGASLGVPDERNIRIYSPEERLPVLVVNGGGMGISGDKVVIDLSSSYHPRGDSLSYDYEVIYGSPRNVKFDKDRVYVSVNRGETWLINVRVCDTRFCSEPHMVAVAGADLILGVDNYVPGDTYRYEVPDGALAYVELKGGEIDTFGNPIMVGLLYGMQHIEGSGVVGGTIYVAPENMVVLDKLNLKIGVYRAMLGDVPVNALKVYHYNGVEWERLDTEVDEEGDLLVLTASINEGGKFAVVAEGIENIREGGCFIATASFGYGDDHLKVLREFRDKVLAKVPGGNALIRFYYSWSPYLAAKIVRHPFLKTVVRFALSPVVWVIKCYFVIFFGGIMLLFVRRKLIWALLIFTFLPLSAYSLDPPHSTINTNDCLNCHTPHSAQGDILTTVYGNPYLCMSCHTSGGLADAKLINREFIAVPGERGNSHAWSKPETNANYGASAPLNTEMQLRIYNGRIVCSTCHDQHLQTNQPFDPNAPLSGNGRHYQRLANDSCQMCVDCHRSRNVQDVRTYTGNYLSHPVGVAYSGGDRRPRPLDYDGQPQTGTRFEGNSTGDSNPTNNFVVDSAGKVTCMTCHWVHYTDGHPGTVDLR